MIAADGENAALLHRSIDIENVIGRAGADIGADADHEVDEVMGMVSVGIPGAEGA